jgi:hypothetical protein
MCIQHANQIGARHASEPHDGQRQVSRDRPDIRAHLTGLSRTQTGVPSGRSGNSFATSIERHEAVSMRCRMASSIKHQADTDGTDTAGIQTCRSITDFACS